MINQNIHKPKTPIYGLKKSTKSAPNFPLKSFWISNYCMSKNEKNVKKEAVVSSDDLKFKSGFLYKKYRGKIKIKR